MPSKYTFLKKILKTLLFLVLISIIIVAVIGYQYFKELQKELPDIAQLEDVEYQIPLKIYTTDGLLLAQFGEKKRSPVDVNKVPQQLINAFLAAEDDRFYTHPGVDYKGLIRAATQLILTGKKKQGGSTITMQVTRNFLLTSEKTYRRKIKEIILALEIEKKFSKNKILEMYLNKIYLGHRSYGINSAVRTYYGKELADLTLAEIAMVAGLPKAPSAYNPVTKPERALIRRNYVLRRMHELEYINQLEYDKAIKQPVTAKLHANKLDLQAPYIAEMVRKEIVEQYGDQAFTLGLKVYTTIQSALQTASTHAVRSALHNYDQRHGYRSAPHTNKTKLEQSDYSKTGDLQTAHILEVKQDTAIAKLQDESLVQLPFKNVKWARKFKSRDYIGAKLKNISEILKPNDIITVRQLEDKSWQLAQIPETEAAFVALNANNGAILALSGGFDFYHNKYNRVTQSNRQPGSGFKPIIYTTALEKGFTPASVINDAPVVIEDPSQGSEWRPENYSKKFFGMTPLRTGLRKSRNLISIRLLRELGIPRVTKTALRFGFTKNQLPNSLSLALGSGQASPLKMSTVYAVFANGGFLVEPYFIDRIEDYKGNTIFQATPKVACPQCSNAQLKQEKFARRVISSEVSFLMNSLLRDVVRRGTATRAKVLGRSDLAGKTGTTNEQRDAWFNGFSSGISASAWLGFDKSKPLGRSETGGKAALPIWIDFMKVALKDKPEQEPIVPSGIIRAYIDPKTGLLAQPGSDDGLWEYFRRRYVPTEYAPIEIDIESEGTMAEEDDLF